MTRHRTIIYSATVLWMAVWVYACGDDSTAPEPPDPPHATTLTVTPSTAELTAIGATVQLSAEVRDQYGQVMTGVAVTWVSSDGSAATVNGSGLVTAVGHGVTTVTATARAASGSAAVTVVPVENLDRAALVALYEATDGLNWARSDGWLSDGPLNSWYGVEVDGQGRVFSLWLDSNNLTGRIPPELGDIAKLSRLYLSGNKLSGPIPPELGKLANLRRLILDRNALSGQIPPELGNLANLSRLEFGRNHLSGPIPPELFSLTNLSGLELGENLLSGPIPPELGSLASLRSLVLGGNHLSGPIPPELGSLANLRALWLCNSGLSGPIPSELGNLANLTDLGLCNNNLSGPIPPEFGDLANLSWLELGRNHLSGPIPPELGNLTSLAYLDLQGNKLTGPVPAEFGNLTELNQLHLGYNNLSGPIFHGFLQLERLNRFYISNTALCVPGIASFAMWLKGIEKHDVESSNLCNAGDLATLKALYQATGGTSWTHSAGWMGDDPIGSWYGVRTDSLGHVTELDLTRNGLLGPLPSSIGDLAKMSAFRISGNAISGRLPLSLSRVSLQEFRYGETQLCTPSDATFQAWLSAIVSHEGTGVECPPLSDLGILEALYIATGGPNWTYQENWLSDAPLRNWQGVEVDGKERVERLSLGGYNLSGTIPPELGNLSNLKDLNLRSNNLFGTIPPELSKLSNLEQLNLGYNDFSGPIPPELGKLHHLMELDLFNNDLSGPIPPELGNSSGLAELWLGNNQLSGPIPSELGNLSDLTELKLGSNNLADPIPPQLGNLSNLTELDLQHNELSGPIPPELGNLSNLTELNLGYNNLSGPVPPEFSGMLSLHVLNLFDNSEMSGALPTELTALAQLRVLLVERTDLCAPDDPAFRAWVRGLYRGWIALCLGDAPAAYLTQAVQSREFPVPLVAGEKALLRVFVTARQATSVGIPAVRARFYHDGRETHVENVPGKSTPIPTNVYEGLLSNSANAEIPGRVMQPGLEMVIEVDHDGKLDPALVVAKRIPETGRLPVEVQPMAVFELTLIPFVWSETQDSSIVDIVKAMAADPENHELLRDMRTLLPVGELEVTAHEPVLSSTNNISALHSQTISIRLMEGGTGHYKGMMHRVSGGVLGAASRPGWTSFSTPDPYVIAHELGHNLSLYHAPCGPVMNFDFGYPFFNPDGSIGAWGYDFEGGGRLVRPTMPDLMSYCSPQWISGYHFIKAMRFRLIDTDNARLLHRTPPTQSLLLWGGVDADSVPFLEPAFVVDASPKLPRFRGQHRLTGHTATGDELFSLSFDMPVVADGDGSSSFAFVLPVRPGWEGNLATITLSGPGGSVTLDGDSDRPMAILRNPRNGQVRGILRDLPAIKAAVQADAAAALVAGPALEVLFSRGIPDAAAWRR